MSAPELPPQSEAGAALTELILLVFRLNGRLLEAAERMAEAGGLTAARWQVLGGVLDEPRTVAEIARRMGLTRQSVQRVANVLVDEGFAAWEPNPRHRRAKLLRPTPRARDAIRRVAVLQHPWSSAIGDAVGEALIRRSSRTLERLLAEIHEQPVRRSAGVVEDHAKRRP
jgi:DNA-binding MarR family transcriptional regulator